MSSESVQYTLVGFSPEIDWKPLRFTKAIPKYRICSACRLVRRKAALLPCMHVLCESCYHQCTSDGARVCPRDGDQCQDEDVEWKECPIEELLNRQVKCWNEESGCKAVAAAADITRHFQLECEYHSVSCFKCSATLLCNDVCAHLKSACSSSMTFPETKSGQPSTCKDETAIFSAFRDALEEQVGDIKAYLERSPIDSTPSDERLNEICHSINDFKQMLRDEVNSLKQALAEEADERERQTYDGFENFITTLVRELQDGNSTALTRSTDKPSEIASAIDSYKKEAKACSEMTLSCLKSLLWNNVLRIDNCEFTVRNVKALKEKAIKAGSADFTIHQVYLRGYCLLPGIRFQKKGDSVTLHITCILYKGDVDDFVQWPFWHSIRLSILHPSGGEENSIITERFQSHEHFKKPAEKMNKGAFFSIPSLDLNELIKKGFVVDDQVQVKWELLP